MDITAPPKPAPTADAARADVEPSLDVARMPPWATFSVRKEEHITDEDEEREHDHQGHRHTAQGYLLQACHFADPPHCFFLWVSSL